MSQFISKNSMQEKCRLYGPEDSDDPQAVDVEGAKVGLNDAVFTEEVLDEPGKEVEAQVLDTQTGEVTEQVIKVVGAARTSASKVTNHRAYADTWERAFRKGDPRLN